MSSTSSRTSRPSARSFAPRRRNKLRVEDCVEPSNCQEAAHGYQPDGAQLPLCCQTPFHTNARLAHSISLLCQLLGHSNPGAPSSYPSALSDDIFLLTSFDTNIYFILSQLVPTLHLISNKTDLNFKSSGCWMYY